jgi:hypothetical protein
MPVAVLIARLHTEFCQFIRQAAPLVRRRVSVFIIRKPDRYNFSNGWAICHWIRYFQVFPYPLHIWNRKWKWSWWNFFYPVYCAVITRWMEHIMRPTRRYSVQKSGRDSRTSQTDRHTDTHTEPTVAWMNLRKNTASRKNSCFQKWFFKSYFQLTLW